MAVKDAKAQLQAMAVPATTLKEARETLETLPDLTIKTITLHPIPMNNGRYGWTGITTVKINGQDTDVQVTKIHPESKSGLTAFNAAMQHLATARAETRSAQTKITNLKETFMALSPAERAALIKAAEGDADDDE